MASQSLIQIADLLDTHKIVFIHELPDRLKCILCKYVLKNAKQTSCGCKVCEKCINTYLKEGEKPCPSKQPDCAETKLMLNRDIHQDNATNREIAELKGKCPFESCTVIDSLKKILTHVDTCEYREMTCDKCSSKYSWKDKDKHAKEECNQRIVNCPHCDKEMTALRKKTEHLNEDHEDLCFKYVSDCKNGCGAMKVNLRDHLKNCTNKKVDCPFGPLQCKVGRLTKANLEMHLQSESISHFQTFVEGLQILKKENESLGDNVRRVQSLLKEQIGITLKLTENQQKLDKTIEDLKKKGSGGATLMPERNVIFRNASFIWKILDFESLKNDAETGMKASVTSDPFYTSEFGYKMCLRIYPYGDGIGRSTHLSVFFAIMKGEYDDVLTWPFKQKVTLSLLDQENYGAKNHSDTFKPDARSACYQKPIDDCNIASGSPKFIPLTNLLNNSPYCKNDTLFLKIAVDTISICRP